MDIENQQVIYCKDDGEYRVYCELCDNLCIERFYKNHLKSKTHTKVIRKREHLKKIISNNLIYLNMEFLFKVCDREIFENELEYGNYITTLRKKNDKGF